MDAHSAGGTELNWVSVSFQREGKLPRTLSLLPSDAAESAFSQVADVAFLRLGCSGAANENQFLVLCFHDRERASLPAMAASNKSLVATPPRYLPVHPAASMRCRPRRVTSGQALQRSRERCVNASRVNSSSP